MSASRTSVLTTAIIMSIISVGLWLLSLILSFIALGVVAQILEWMIWALVVAIKFPKYLKNWKIWTVALIGFVLSSIPIINIIPESVISNILTFVIISRQEKRAAAEKEAAKLEEEEKAQNIQRMRYAHLRYEAQDAAPINVARARLVAENRMRIANEVNTIRSGQQLLQNVP